MADVTEVDYDTSLVVNGRSPFRIRGQWHDEGAKVVRLFDSDAIWYDPIEFVKPGDEIAVYYDRAKPGRYVVDLSALPKLAE